MLEQLLSFSSTCVFSVLRLQGSNDEHLTKVSIIFTPVFLILAIIIPYSGFFRGGKFSRIALIQLFEGENFHESRQEHTVPNVFSKYFEGKIFMNVHRFVKFVKISPSKKPAIW